MTEAVHGAGRLPNESRGRPMAAASSVRQVSSIADPSPARIPPLEP